MNEFKNYKRKITHSEMRLYIFNEDLTGISVSKEDDPINDMGMIARNPLNHKDKWYVSKAYVLNNFLDTGLDGN